MRSQFDSGDSDVAFHAAHERSFRVRCRHRSTADQSLDDETVVVLPLVNFRRFSSRHGFGFYLGISLR